MAVAAVGKEVVVGARAAPRRWMMEYLHSWLIMCEAYITVLYGAILVEGDLIFHKCLYFVVNGDL